jgi:hypothetical protein
MKVKIGSGLIPESMRFLRREPRHMRDVPWGDGPAYSRYLAWVFAGAAVVLFALVIFPM